MVRIIRKESGEDGVIKDEIKIIRSDLRVGIGNGENDGIGRNGEKNVLSKRKIGRKEEEKVRIINGVGKREEIGI